MTHLLRNFTIRLNLEKDRMIFIIDNIPVEIESTTEVHTRQRRQNTLQFWIKIHSANLSSLKQVLIEWKRWAIEKDSPKISINMIDIPTLILRTEWPTSTLTSTILKRKKRSIGWMSRCRTRTSLIRKGIAYKNRGFIELRRSGR